MSLRTLLRLDINGVGGALDGSGNLSLLRNHANFGDLTNGTPATRPGIVSSPTLGGQPSTRMVAANSTTISGTGTYATGQPFTAIAAFTSFITTFSWLFRGLASGAGIAIRSATIISIGADGGFIDATLPSTLTPVIISGWFNGANSVIRANGVTMGTGNIGSSSLSAGFRLGNDSGASFYDGDIARLRIWNRLLSLSETQFQERAFANACRLPIDTRH